MSKVSVAAALVQSDAVFVMPTSGGSVGQVLSHSGNHPTIAGAKLLSWQTISLGGYLSYSSNQELTLTQLRTVKRNLIQGSSPIFTYTGENLSSITYIDGSVKTFSYSGSLLTRIDHTYSNPSRTYRKDFSYDGSNKLVSITESLF